MAYYVVFIFSLFKWNHYFNYRYLVGKHSDVITLLHNRILCVAMADQEMTDMHENTTMLSCDDILESALDADPLKGFQIWCHHAFTLVMIFKFVSIKGFHINLNFMLFFNSYDNVLWCVFMWRWCLSFLRWCKCFRKIWEIIRSICLVNIIVATRNNVDIPSTGILFVNICSKGV